MATGTEFEQFFEDLAAGVHSLIGTTPGTDIDELKIYLSNTAPNAATHETKTDVSEISTGNGYSGAQGVSPSGSRSGGTVTVTADEVVITGDGGSVSEFRYVILFNDTPSSPADPLIGYWDHGEGVTLGDGESFRWRPNSQQSGGNLLTIS